MLKTYVNFGFLGFFILKKIFGNIIGTKDDEIFTTRGLSKVAI